MFGNRTMWIIVGVILAMVFVVSGYMWYANKRIDLSKEELSATMDDAQTPQYNEPSDDAVVEASRTEVIAENLTIPWEILFLPDGEMLITERPGNLVLLDEGTRITVPDVRHTGEGGLLGATLHPDFETNAYLYLYQTIQSGGGLANRIVRYTFRDGEIAFDRVILDDIPGAIYHDGGRIAFGPDGYLYATVGDATLSAQAQDEETLHGTILRMTDEGEPAPGNAFDSLVYSYGHRNPQGLAWDEERRLWSSEHGRSGLQSGYDEINLIEAGANYGWPESQGDEVASGTRAPVRHSMSDTTWAPGDLAFLDGSLFMPGLQGETLYEAVLDGEEIVDWKEYFVGQYGRLRTVRVGPDGFLYLLTSNRDGRGDSELNDDRIIRIDPTLLD